MKDGWGFILGKDYIVGSDGSVNIYFMDFLNFKGIFYLGFIILWWNLNIDFWLEFLSICNVLIGFVLDIYRD